jgi:hypothetical protein
MKPLPFCPHCGHGIYVEEHCVTCGLYNPYDDFMRRRNKIVKLLAKLDIKAAINRLRGGEATRE